MLLTKYPYYDDDEEVKSETDDSQLNEDINYIKTKLKQHKELFINSSLPFHLNDSIKKNHENKNIGSK